MLARSLLIFTAFLSVMIALISYRFIVLGYAVAFPAHTAHLQDRNLAFLVHVSAAPVALLVGTFQFFAHWRARHLVLHRAIGRVYVLAVVVGALSGLILATASPGGPVARLGFAILALLWLIATVQAVRHAIAGRIARHRKWMMRSFALTFAGVTLRIYLLFFMAGGMGYVQAAPYLAWLCWVPNLLLVEWLMRERRPAAVSA